MNMGFFGALGLVFIVLKLTEYIAWSWWLVLAPIYVPFVILIGLFFILALAGLNPKFKVKKKD